MNKIQINPSVFKKIKCQSGVIQIGINMVNNVESNMRVQILTKIIRSEYIKRLRMVKTEETYNFSEPNRFGTVWRERFWSMKTSNEGNIGHPLNPQGHYLRSPIVVFESILGLKAGF